MPITQFDKPPQVGDEVEFNVEGYDPANGVLKLTREGVRPARRLVERSRSARPSKPRHRHK